MIILREREVEMIMLDKEDESTFSPPGELHGREDI